MTKHLAMASCKSINYTAAVFLVVYLMTAPSETTCQQWCSSRYSHHTQGIGKESITYMFVHNKLLYTCTPCTDNVHVYQFIQCILWLPRQAFLCH